MSDLDVQKPDNAEEFQVEGATVPFYKYKVGETEYIEFDTSRCGPPEPMVNAMIAVGLIKGPNTKVIMINHKKPMGLLDKIGENFDIEDTELDDGRAKLVFSYREGSTEKADLSDKSCH